MAVRHPIDAVPPGELRYRQVPSLAIAAICLFALPFILPARADNTIVELVEAGSAAKATAILSHWTSEDRIRAAYAVGLDFLMNPAYMNVLAISAVWAGRTFQSPRMRAIASSLAWLGWSVVLSNIVENIGLYLALSDAPVSPWPLLIAGAHYWAGLSITSILVFSGIGLLNRLHQSRQAG